MSADGASIALSGADTQANYLQALRGIGYQNSSDSPNTTDRIITLSLSDGSLTSNLATSTIQVVAVNDAPVAVADTAIAVEAGGTANVNSGTNPNGNVLTNDTDVDAGDTRTVTGVAAGTVANASTNVATNIAGSFGSINIAADGSYTYTVDNTSAAVQALRTNANTLQDVFSYTITDADGLTSTTQITITIQGANDTPTITSDGGGATAAITMAENITAVTTVVGSDVDAGTTLTYTIVGGADAAKFTITAGGSLTFVTALTLRLHPMLVVTIFMM